MDADHGQGNGGQGLVWSREGFHRRCAILFGGLVDVKQRGMLTPSVAVGLVKAKPECSAATRRFKT